jgi:hypothetical protein
VSRVSVARWEGRHLHPILDEDGVHRFDPVEVRALKCKPSSAKALRVGPTKGDMEAAITRMLRAGHTRPDIVVALKVEYDEVQRVWEHLQAVTCKQADRLKHQREEDERRREQERKEQEAWDRQMREIEENNAKLVAQASAPYKPRGDRR